jgi:hypothetical protein
MDFEQVQPVKQAARLPVHEVRGDCQGRRERPLRMIICCGRTAALGLTEKFS